MARVSVKKSEPPETKEILANAIIKIGAAAKRLHDDGLNETAIVALLQDATKLPKRSIKLVLSALRQLEGWYCR